MTYGRFLGLFLLLPIVWMAWRSRRVLDARLLVPLSALLVVVYVATTPWDNAAVARGIWSFDPDRVWGLWLLYLPLEEYLFFGLQTVLTGLWVGQRLRRLEAER